MLVAGYLILKWTASVLCFFSFISFAAPALWESQRCSPFGPLDCHLAPVYNNALIIDAINSLTCIL